MVIKSSAISVINELGKIYSMDWYFSEWGYTFIFYGMGELDQLIIQIEDPVKRSHRKNNNRSKQLFTLAWMKAMGNNEIAFPFGSLMQNDKCGFNFFGGLSEKEECEMENKGHIDF